MKQVTYGHHRTQHDEGWQQSQHTVLDLEISQLRMSDGDDDEDGGYEQLQGYDGVDLHNKTTPSLQVQLRRLLCLQTHSLLHLLVGGNLLLELDVGLAVHDAGIIF